MRAIFPLRVTVTVVTPRLIAMTLPASDTVTIVGSFDTHFPEELEIPLIGLPDLSYARSVSWIDCPVMMVAESGPIARRPIGACTDTTAVSVERFDAATTFAVPIARPETRPVLETVATFGLVLCQLTLPPSGDDATVSCCTSSTPTSIAFCANDRRPNSNFGSAGPVASHATMLAARRMILAGQDDRRIADDPRVFVRRLGWPGATDFAL